MNTKHKHYDIVVAWLNGATIQFKSPFQDWTDVEGDDPLFLLCNEYRIKPKPELDYPTTLMDSDQLQDLYHTEGVLGQSCIAIANAAIRHAIDSGQVIIAPNGE